MISTHVLTNSSSDLTSSINYYQVWLNERKIRHNSFQNETKIHKKNHSIALNES